MQMNWRIQQKIWETMIQQQKDSHPIQALWKRINHKTWNLLHQLVWSPRMQNPGKLSHVWSRHVFCLLIPVVHNPTLPLAIRSICCCKSNMVFRFQIPWRVQSIRLPTPQIGSFVVYYHSQQIIRCKEKPKWQKRQKYCRHTPHVFPFNHAYVLLQEDQITNLYNLTQPNSPIYNSFWMQSTKFLQHPSNSQLQHTILRKKQYPFIIS